MKHSAARLCLLVICLNVTALRAQSDHYWTQNFNTESSLVAGAVLGGAAGPSAVYYNPALINEKEANRLSLSMNLMSMHYTKVENLAGTETKTDRFNFLIQPKFISYTGNAKKNKKITYEVAILTPIKKDLRIDYFYNTKLDIIKRLDGIESYDAKIIYRDKYQDLYFGGGFSYRINEMFSIGVSGFLSVKLLEFSTNISMKAMQEGDTVYSNGIPEPYYSAVNNSSEWLKYYDLSIIIKAGFHYQSLNGKLGAGVKVSLPNIHIYGEGKVNKEYKRAEVYNDLNNSFTENLDFVGYQEHVLTNIKDPLSIALGLQYRTKNKKNAIMLSMEYFFPIDTYSLLKTRNTETSGNLKVPDIPKAMSYFSSSDGVFNFALGYVQYFSEKFTVAGGFKTDFNNLSTVARSTNPEDLLHPRMRNLYLDKYHLLVGPSFRIKTFGVILGIQYSWGRQWDLPNIANFSNPIEFNPETNKSLQGIQENNMVLKYNEITLFFGVTYGFSR